MRIWTRLTAMLALLAATACAAEPPPPPQAEHEADHPLVGRLWRPAEGRFATIDEALAATLAADAVLLGETHDNPDHHALQAWMLRRLTAAGRRPNVVFEMFDAGQTGRLNAHLAAHPGDAEGIGDAIGWAENGWPDWPLYRPIAEAALASGGRLIAGDLARPQVRAIARGTEPTATLEDLGITTELDAATLDDMKAEIREDHCNLMPEAALAGMVRVQRARDAALARALAQGLKDGGGAVLIAGAGHVRADRAVPAQLPRFAPGRSVIAIAFQEVDADRLDPTAYGVGYPGDRQPYDLVWFTRRAEREDQCEELRRQMQKKKPG